MRTYLISLLIILTLTSCGGGNDGASTGTPVVAQATIAQTVTACEASATYGGTGPIVNDFSVNPSIYQCWDALPGIAWGNPWAVNLYGGCAKSKSFGGTEPLLLFAQKDACITALNNAENIQQCFSLGGKSWTVGKESGGGVMLVLLCKRNLRL